MKSVVRMFIVVLIIVLVAGCGGKQAGIEGKVVDGKGQPMSGVRVIAKQVQPLKGYEQFETTTGSDGVFKFKGLFPASEYTVYPQPKTGRASVKVTAKSGPEGQTSMLSSPLTIRFTVSSDGIITDSQLGLQWAPAPTQRMNWFQAENWAQNLSLGGGGWRLPTRSELKSIYEELIKGGEDSFFNIKYPIFWIWASENEGKWAWGSGEGTRARDGSDYTPAYALAVRSPK
jgi:hypothetical protein